MEDLEKYWEIQKRCVGYIFEFLKYNNMDNSVSTMKRELSLNFPGTDIPDDNIIKVKPHIKRNHVITLLDLLKSSRPHDFFEAWSSIVPEEIQCTSDYKRLTVLLQVHFAIDPIKNESPTKELSSEPLKEVCDDLNRTYILRRPGVFMYDSRTSGSSDLEEIIEIELGEMDIEKDSLENEPIVSPKIGVKKPFGMSTFRDFLLEKGQVYGTETDVLQYFALPFVSNPKEHPLYKEIFKESWILELEKSLVSFLVKYSCGEEVLPGLSKLLAQHEGSTALLEASENSQSKNTFSIDSLMPQYKELKRKYRKLNQDHRNIVLLVNWLQL